MSGVIGRPTLKRQDIIISTVADQKIGFRWWRSLDHGATREPVDLTGFSGVARLSSMDGVVWAELPLELSTVPADPLVTLTTTPADFSASEWAARTTGEYQIRFTAPDSAVTILATGYLYLDR